MTHQRRAFVTTAGSGAGVRSGRPPRQRGGWSKPGLRGMAYRRQVGFQAASSVHVLRWMRAFPTRVVDSSAPTSWHTLAALCLDSAVYHVGEWHSTMMSVCYWEPTGEWQSRPIASQDFEAGNVLDQLNQVLRACKGTLRCDR